MCLREGREVCPSQFKHPIAFRNSAASPRDNALHKEQNRWWATVAAKAPASRMDKVCGWRPGFNRVSSLGS